MRRRRRLRGGLRRDARRRSACRPRCAPRPHRHDLPVCGPNCDGIVALPRPRGAVGRRARARARPATSRVISQSGNVAVNALAARRGLRLHTVVSCGNQAVVDAGDWLHALAAARGRALGRALPGERRRRRAAVRGAGAVRRRRHRRRGAQGRRLGRRGERGRRAHGRGGRRPRRLPRAGARRPAPPGRTTCTSCSSWPRRWRCRGARPRGDGGLAILTCSGGDSGLGADEAQRRGLELPAAAARHGRARARAAAGGRHRRQPARLHGASSGARSRRCAT